MYTNDELNKEFLSECKLCRKEDFPSVEALDEKAGALLERTAPGTLMIFVVEGRIEVSSGFATFRPVDENHFFLLPSGARYEFRFVSDSKCLIFNLMSEVLFCERYYSGTLGEAMRLGANNEGCDVFILETNNKLANLLDEVSYMLLRGFVCPYYVKCKTDEMLILVCLFYATEDLAKFYMPVFKGNTIFKSLVMHYRNKLFSVQELADVAHLNRDTFRRRFKEVFGVGPSKWIQQQRAELIMEQFKLNLPIVSVMDRCGFSFHSDFTRFCKKHLKLSPVMLQKLIKSQNTA
jgi:AraC-like DNA-binding protein